MARFYSLPCYSTAGVGDVSEPGVQATVEKLMTLLTVPRSGAQYIHYAFGLLERTNVFCPEQAVMDDAHIGIAKQLLREAPVSEGRRGDVLATIREVMSSDHKTYVYHLPLPSREKVYVKYPLESEQGALRAAHEAYHKILERPRAHLPREIQKDIAAAIPGVLQECLAD
jgi:trimethylamine--corrinoid protein Co-methyltransferase